MVAVSPLKVIVSMVLWVILMGTLSSIYFWQWLHAPHQISDTHRFFTVESGESLTRVANKLHKTDIIRWPQIWLLYARFHDVAPIRKGEYNFNSKESPVNILDKLQSDEVVTYTVTLIEGKSFTEYVDLLAQQPKITAKLSGLSLAEQLEHINIDVVHHEGWFYPDTYQFIAGDTDVTVFRRAHKKMKAFLASEWEGRAKGLPYASAYEALIMASIIEKETGAAYERPQIAGVFVRRLQKGMRLQTDPTVIYGLGDNYNGNLTRKHLKTLSPYNTYRISGLPPTPIAMPSGASIHAALHPEPGSSLYFVAKGDGSHYFSDTLEQHNKAVSKFQKKGRVKKYRSAPPKTNVKSEP